MHAEAYNKHVHSLTGNRLHHTIHWKILAINFNKQCLFVFFFRFSHSAESTHTTYTHTSLTRSNRRIWKLHIFAFVYFKHFIRIAIHVIVLLSLEILFCICGWVLCVYSFVRFSFFCFCFARTPTGIHWMWRVCVLCIQIMTICCLMSRREHLIFFSNKSVKSSKIWWSFYCILLDDMEKDYLYRLLLFLKNLFTTKN